MRYSLRAVGEAAFFVVAIAGGVVAALAPIAWPGLVLGGSACGGAGREQVCRGLARQLTLVEIDDEAWLWVAGGAACAVLGIAGLVVRGQGFRLAAAAAVLGLAVAGLVTTTRVDVKLGPAGSGTYGRGEEAWGAYIAPSIRDFRADAIRRYEGRRERPGAPPFEREQILESSSVRTQLGWKLLRLAVAALLFASLFEVARQVVRLPSLAAVIALTCGAVLWAAVADRSYECDPGASECYRGLGTFLAIVAAALAWAAYGIGVALGRLMLPRPPRRRE